jgi:hypothetical protein
MRGGVVLLALSFAGCAAEPRPAAVTATTVEVPASADDGAKLTELRQVERRVVALLAASDSRFARRAGGVSEKDRHSAVVKALAAGDPDAAVEDGALDAFSFTARQRAIDAASELAAGARDEGAGPEGQSERAALLALVAAERFRLGEERDLPRGASALVRSLVETWEPAPASASPEATKLRDARVARRLDEVRASLEGQASRVSLAELDDALDPLERLATPADYGRTAKALAALRLALDAAATHAFADEGSWAHLQAALRVYLGVDASAEELKAQLERTESTLRAQAKELVGSSREHEHEIAAEADRWTLRDEPCLSVSSQSPVLALYASPERAPSCRAAQAFESVDLGPQHEAAVVALHDAAVVALWSLAIHVDHAPPSRATASVHTFFGADPDREARLVRFAVARPVAAIAAGLAATSAKPPPASPRP